MSETTAVDKGQGHIQDTCSDGLLSQVAGPVRQPLLKDRSEFRLSSDQEHHVLTLQIHSDMRRTHGKSVRCLALLMRLSNIPTSAQLGFPHTCLLRSRMTVVDIMVAWMRIIEVVKDKGDEDDNEDDGDDT